MIGRENGKESAPSIPKRKVARNLIAPSTPTPAAVNSLATASRPLETRDKTPEPPVDRVADPYTTNAPLISPETSRLVTNKAVADLSPSKLAKPRLTTGGILDQALKHLIETEPKLKTVVEKHHCHIFSPEGLAEVIDPFVSLASSIIGQQVSSFEIASFCLQQRMMIDAVPSKKENLVIDCLMQVSGAAAKSIKAKFAALFNPDVAERSAHTFPTPSQVVATDIATLRTAGLSQRKAEYIQGLAEKFASGELSTDILMKAEYEEIFEKLIAVRGLGKWSVEMFACFGLKRLDVFSTGDLGVQ
jgi:DNA-3-methyladenine glycosylase II